MSDVLYSTREILREFAETVWFPLVLGMVHTVKELTPLLALLKKDGLISFSTNRRRFDKIVRDFERCVVTYVTRTTRKDLGIMAQFADAGNQGSVAAGVAAAAAANSQSNAGQSFWLRDIFGDQPVAVLSQLDTRSRNNCTWLQKYSGDIALRKCSLLFETSIISLIQRNLSDARQQGVSLTWLFAKRLVRHKIPDNSPRMFMKTFVTMFRPDGM